MWINNAVLLWAMAIAIGVGQPTMASEMTLAIEQLDTRKPLQKSARLTDDIFVLPWS
jgi:hypothetical protein